MKSKSYLYVQGLLLLLFFLFFNSAVISQITYIPDPDFEQALIDLGIDSDGEINGQVLTADIENVESLELNQRFIHDFTGIQDFAALEILDVSWNKMTILDLSGNENLIELKFNYSRYLQSLDLSNNPNLERIYCNETMLSELDLSKCYNLKELILGEPSPGDNSGIEMLDLSNSPYLEKLQLINHTLLKKVDLRSGNNNILIDVFVECVLDFGYVCEPAPCFMVDDLEAAQNHEFPYSEWDADVAFSEDCVLGITTLKETDFSISENPVHQNLILTAPGFSGNVNLEIYSIQGKLLKNENLHVDNQASIDVSQLAAGVYVLKIIDDMYGVTTGRFIKR